MSCDLTCSQFTARSSSSNQQSLNSTRNAFNQSSFAIAGRRTILLTIPDWMVDDITDDRRFPICYAHALIVFTIPEGSTLPALVSPQFIYEKIAEVTLIQKLGL